MAILTANRPFPNTVQPRGDATGCVVDMVMTVSSQVYEGSFVGFAAGVGTIAVIATSGSQVFAGIAMKKVLSDSTAGSTKCPVLTNAIFDHAVASGAATSIGAVVFASDDNTLDLTSTTRTAVGRVLNYNPVSGLCTIQMKMTGEVSGSVGTTYTASNL